MECFEWQAIYAVAHGGQKSSLSMTNSASWLIWGKCSFHNKHFFKANIKIIIKYLFLVKGSKMYYVTINVFVHIFVMYSHKCI